MLTSLTVNKMATIHQRCFVHDQKYLRKLHETINQLRQKYQFASFILQQLPKRCFSRDKKIICLILVDKTQYYLAFI